MKKFWGTATCVLVSFLIAACQIPTPQTPLTPVFQTATPIPTATQPASDTWQPLFAGAEIRTRINGVSRTALRVNPQIVKFDVAFTPRPNEMRSVGGWLETRGALAAINCGFYASENNEIRMIGLLASATTVYSNTRRGWGGALHVRNGKAVIYAAPSPAQGALQLGVQGWPMLVRNGKALTGLNNSDLDVRTAAAVDNDGRVLFITDGSGQSLNAFAQVLAASNLGIVHAVNLDGGSSTGMKYRPAATGTAQGLDSFPVPCAILLLP